MRSFIKSVLQLGQLKDEEETIGTAALLKAAADSIIAAAQYHNQWTSLIEGLYLRNNPST